MDTEANFTEIDVQKLRTEVLTQAEQRTGELLYPGDERRIFIDVLIYILSWFIGVANKMCRSRLLPYASGYQLDALGERVNCTRIAPVPASVMLKFTLETTRPNDITIPAGTTVTADNKVLFAVDRSTTIPAGSLSVDGAAATATVGGSVTNGIPAGAIQSFVDRVPYVTGVVNTSESSGGDDGEPYPRAIDPVNGDDGEGDDRYRERIKLAPAAFSAAGSAASYEYWAKSASGNVESVGVLSNQAAGTIDIYISERGGSMPTDGTLALVGKAVTADDVKPLNDLVRVHAPTAVEYGIELKYYVPVDSESESVEAIEGAGGAIEQYIAWQNAQIGRDINPDQLRAFMLPYCTRIELVNPQYRAVAQSELPQFNGVKTISHVAE